MTPKQIIFENSNETLNIDKPWTDPYKTKPGEKPYKLEIAWFNVIVFIYIHLSAFYAVTLDAKSLSAYYIITMILFEIPSGLGITAGAHRYFCHRSYKANQYLKYLLCFLQTIALQNSVIEWCRDHRVHHKYSDTNADPHNANRGFFFSHMGWLMCKKHPDVKRYGAKIDMSDLTTDPLLQFQHKYYPYLAILCSIILPAWLCTLCGESWWNAYHFQLFRLIQSWHLTWAINSFSHLWGNRPFEKNIKPTDTLAIGILSFGEGWHNYHHVYPWDYKVSELPYSWCNFTIAFINFFANIGWATDLKTVSADLIRKRVLRTGDGTHRYSIEELNNKNILEMMELYSNQKLDENDNLWGWDDLEMDPEERDARLLSRAPWVVIVTRQVL